MENSNLLPVWGAASEVLYILKVQARQDDFGPWGLS